MSHSVTFKTVFKDIRAVAKAFVACGWTIQQDAHIRHYQAEERDKVRKLVAVNPGNDIYDYDLAIEQHANGEITLIHEEMLSYSHLYESLLGKDFCLLNHAYVKEVVTAFAASNLGSVEMTTGADGVTHGVLEMEVLL